MTPGPQQQRRGGNPYNSIRRFPAQNASSSRTIPAFGLVVVTGTTTEGALIVDQPTSAGQDVYVNGPQPIQPNNGADPPLGGYGSVSKDFPIWAAYNPGTITGGVPQYTPAIGDTWGPTAGSYLLTQGNAGFTIQAVPVIQIIDNAVVGTPRVLIAPTQINLAYVQPITTTPSQIILGRTITDAILDGTDVLVSPSQANFTAKDVGALLVGTGIPGDTTILSVGSSTTVTMSNAATVDAENVSVQIQTGAKKGYAGVINFQDAAFGSWKRRTITDVTLTDLSTALDSAIQGAFTLGDDGAFLFSADIPDGTTATLFNSTTLTMSAAATGNATNATVIIQQGALQTCWFVEGNDSVWYPPTSPPSPQPVSIPIRSDVNYQCRFFQNDADGTPIYEVVETPHTIMATFNSGTPNSGGVYDCNEDLFDPPTETHSDGIGVWYRDANS